MRSEFECESIDLCCLRAGRLKYVSFVSREEEVYINSSAGKSIDIMDVWLECIMNK